MGAATVPSRRMDASASRWPGTADIFPIKPYIPPPRLAPPPDLAVADAEDAAAHAGPQQVFQPEAELYDEVGVVTSLAWTENGGEIMPVEVAVLEGKGGLQMTGQMGEVMQESGQAALTYIKSRAPQLNIDFEVFERMDIHVHMPEGGIPKDGPSAGITMAAAITSALLRVPVRQDIAMTGEITLRGRVLPVGGLKDKILAAHRAEIFEVIIPEENEKDLKDIPKRVLKMMTIHPVKHMDQVLKLALALADPDPHAR